MSQARSRGEGTNTNPSSPSLGAAVPAMRRQGNRASSITSGSPGAIRSQSQPGRSLPHPLTLHQQVHPGYDVSGAISAQYQHLRTTHGLMPGMPLTLSPVGAFPGVSSRDNAMPKEYVGYYVGHSPQLGPQSQYATAVPNPMSSMPHRDSPSQRPRRVTPDLAPPTANGCHTSRSPSPLSHQRSYPSLAERRATQSRPMHNANDADLPVPLSVSNPSTIDIGGPLIVNGSNPSYGTEPIRLTNGVHGKDSHIDHQRKSPAEKDPSRMRSLSIRTADPAMDGRVEAVNGTNRTASPQRVSPRSTAQGSGSVVSPSPNVEPVLEQFIEPLPLSAPLLSPVAEMRTPSPTQHGVFDKLDSPVQGNGHVQSKLRMVDRQQDENTPSQVKHERKGSAPNPTQYGKPAKSPIALTPTAAGTNAQNVWQQATRKGHKKSKSNIGPKTALGKAMPVNELERKGG
nr:hypothetical protein CFP56_53268 [Quercus suber]